VGLLGGIIWNKRTGNLVAGHQRVSILDSLEGTADYLLIVDMVDLDEATEREQNVFLNNKEAQGDWDLAKLGQLFKGKEKVSNEAAGFDLGQIYAMFGEQSLADNPEGMQQLSEAVRKSKEVLGQIAEKAAQRDGFKFYRVLVFKDDDQAAQCMAVMGFPVNQLMIDGVKFAEKAKVNISIAE
jgi:hypothetical protein